MQTSNDRSELLEVDRPTHISRHVLPEADQRLIDHVGVRQRRRRRKAFSQQPSRQPYLARHIGRPRRYPDDGSPARNT